MQDVDGRADDHLVGGVADAVLRWLFLLLKRGRRARPTAQLAAVHSGGGGGGHGRAARVGGLAVRSSGATAVGKFGIGEHLLVRRLDLAGLLLLALPTVLWLVEAHIALAAVLAVPLLRVAVLGGWGGGGGLVGGRLGSGRLRLFGGRWVISGGGLVCMQNIYFGALASLWRVFDE